MNSLSATEVDRMAAAIGETLPTAVAIYRATRTSDSAGGAEVTETLVETTTCRLDVFDTRRHHLEVIAQRLEDRDFYAATLPAEADILPGDALVIGTTTYDVAGIQNAETWETCLIAIIARRV